MSGRRLERHCEVKQGNPRRNVGRLDAEVVTMIMAILTEILFHNSCANHVIHKYCVPFGTTRTGVQLRVDPPTTDDDEARELADRWPALEIRYQANQQKHHSWKCDAYPSPMP